LGDSFEGVEKKHHQVNESILTAVVIETMVEAGSDSITQLLWFGKHHIPIEHQIVSVIAKLV
jgi:hypothetical protein